MTTDQTALLIIRVQFEKGGGSPLLVQLHETTDVSAGFAGTPVATSIDALAELIPIWLASVHAPVGA